MDTASPPRAALDDTPSLPAIQALAAADMAAVDALIRRRLASDVVLVNQVAEYIVGAGGKRLRPMLLLLAAAALGKRGADGAGVGADAHQLAAVIEFIHTSTLLHDDVVDESDLRRGRSTANAVWGNAASVLVGDFLYSRSFQMMVELDRMEVMQLLADATNRIAEGEVLQLLHVRNPDTDEAAYLQVIERKTAVLFAAATRLGALLAGGDAATCDALHDYGLNLGYAFQIADDVLDYSADEAALGKHLGDDLAEGKATLSTTPQSPRASGGAGPSSMGTPARCRRWRPRWRTPTASATACDAPLVTSRPPCVRSRTYASIRTWPRFADWRAIWSVTTAD